MKADGDIIFSEIIPEIIKKEEFQKKLIEEKLQEIEETVQKQSKNKKPIEKEKYKNSLIANLVDELALKLKIYINCVKQSDDNNRTILVKLIVGMIEEIPDDEIATMIAKKINPDLDGHPNLIADLLSRLASSEILPIPVWRESKGGNFYKEILVRWFIKDPKSAAYYFPFLMPFIREINYAGIASIIKGKQDYVLLSEIALRFMKYIVKRNDNNHIGVMPPAFTQPITFYTNHLIKKHGERVKNGNAFEISITHKNSEKEIKKIEYEVVKKLIYWISGLISQIIGGYVEEKIKQPLCDQQNSIESKREIIDNECFDDELLKKSLNRLSFETEFLLFPFKDFLLSESEDEKKINEICKVVKDLLNNPVTFDSIFKNIRDPYQGFKELFELLENHTSHDLDSFMRVALSNNFKVIIPLVEFSKGKKIKEYKDLLENLKKIGFGGKGDLINEALNNRKQLTSEIKNLWKSVIKILLDNILSQSDLSLEHLLTKENNEYKNLVLKLYNIIINGYLDNKDEIEIKENNTYFIEHLNQCLSIHSPGFSNPEEVLDKLNNQILSPMYNLQNLNKIKKSDIESLFNPFYKSFEEKITKFNGFAGKSENERQKLLKEQFQYIISHVEKLLKELKRNEADISKITEIMIGKIDKSICGVENHSLTPDFLKKIVIDNIFSSLKHYLKDVYRVKNKFSHKQSLIEEIRTFLRSNASDHKKIRKKTEEVKKTISEKYKKIFNDLLTELDQMQRKAQEASLIQELKTFLNNYRDKEIFNIDFYDQFDQHLSKLENCNIANPIKDLMTNKVFIDLIEKISEISNTQQNTESKPKLSRTSSNNKKRLESMLPISMADLSKMIRALFTNESTIVNSIDNEELKAILKEWFAKNHPILNSDYGNKIINIINDYNHFIPEVIEKILLIIDRQYFPYQMKCLGKIEDDQMLNEIAIYKFSLLKEIQSLNIPIALKNEIEELLSGKMDAVIKKFREVNITNIMRDIFSEFSDQLESNQKQKWTTYSKKYLEFLEKIDDLKPSSQIKMDLKKICYKNSDFGRILENISNFALINNNPLVNFSHLQRKKLSETEILDFTEKQCGLNLSTVLGAFLYAAGEGVGSNESGLPPELIIKNFTEQSFEDDHQEKMVYKNLLSNIGKSTITDSDGNSVPVSELIGKVFLKVALNNNDSIPPDPKPVSPTKESLITLLNMLNNQETSSESHRKQELYQILRMFLAIETESKEDIIQTLLWFRSNSIDYTEISHPISNESILQFVVRININEEINNLFVLNEDQLGEKLEDLTKKRKGSGGFLNIFTLVNKPRTFRSSRSGSPKKERSSSLTSSSSPSPGRTSIEK